MLTFDHVFFSFEEKKILHNFSLNIEKGEIVASMYANKEELFESAVNQFLSSIRIEETAPDINPLIIDIVE